MNGEKPSHNQLVDWVESEGFLMSLNQLIAPTGAIVGPFDQWLPKDATNLEQVRLERLADSFPNVGWQDRLRDWWLKHPRSGATLSWDFGSTCEFDEKKGLILIQAAAETSELSDAGIPIVKRKSKEAQLRAEENNEHIRGALEFASSALHSLVPGTRLSADHHYELASRVAHAWWLANNGIPTVLAFLGFLGKDFQTNEDWLAWFQDYSRAALPERFTGRWIDCGETSFYVLAASLPTP